MSYERRVYRAPSGQWSWEITKDGQGIVGGAGYEDEFEAQTDADAELAHLEAQTAASKQSQYPIEAGIPIPDEILRRRKCGLPTDALAVGQSFLAPHSDYSAVLRNVTRRRHDGRGKKFVMRVLHEGIRVWRTE